MLAVIIVVVIVVIALIGALSMAARRRRLRQQFGPEYDRVVGEQDSRRRGEAELAGRQRRVRKLDIQPLSDDARNRYLAQWQTIQEQFVDSPQTANTDAYALVTTVMRERGYPVDDNEQVLADLSVEHAETVGHFPTEDLRQAFIHYRALFADLLGDPALLSADQSAAALNGSGTSTYETASVPAQPVSDDDVPSVTDEVDPVTDEAEPVSYESEPVADEVAADPARTDPDGVPVTAAGAEQPLSSPRQQGR
jgi:hypothetical protein